MKAIYTRHTILREEAAIAAVGRCISYDREHEKTGRHLEGVLQIGNL
jgi:hypothetical protein